MDGIWDMPHRDLDSNQAEGCENTSLQQLLPPKVKSKPGPVCGAKG